MSNIQNNMVALTTIVSKEIRRFARIWVQTLLPPAITMALYFVIFGRLIGSQIGSMHNFNYMQYIAPGLIMMSVITNSYMNVVSSFFSTKFMRSVEELLVSPVPNSIILLGYVIGGVARGLCVGLIVTTLTLFFTELHIQHIGVTMAIVLLTAVVFSLGGFINAVYANSFDDVTIVPTFVLTPLTYFGGVFYSIDMLPEFWRNLSLANPILYMVNTFRYGILGVSDVPVEHAFTMIGVCIVALTAYAMYLLNVGKGLRQ
jgi:ABC-2 type transport system permease protein